MSHSRRALDLKILSVLLFSLLLFATRSESQTYVIAGKAFQPVFTNSSDAGYLKVYLPAGQTPTNWTRSFNVRCLKKDASPKNYIVNLGDTYHKKYPQMQFASGGEQSKNRWFIDFMTLSQKTDSQYLQWEFFRAQPNVSGGIVLFQFTERRAYKTSVDELKAWNIQALRKQMIPFLTTNEFKIP